MLSDSHLAGFLSQHLMKKELERLIHLVDVGPDQIQHLESGLDFVVLVDAAAAEEEADSVAFDLRVWFA